MAMDYAGKELLQANVTRTVVLNKLEKVCDFVPAQTGGLPELIAMQSMKCQIFRSLLPVNRSN